MLLGGKNSKLEVSRSLHRGFQHRFSVSLHEFSWGLRSLLEPPWALSFIVQALKPLTRHGATHLLRVFVIREKSMMTSDSHVGKISGFMDFPQSERDLILSDT